ncbi:transposase (plasmid) [Sinorhizobium meliloti WSM1022]|uniref:transposase n=1 Tax=Rhizobium meliloti TaxID=382 RepID=UPI0009B88263|nr:transposase [Sinorhizobium meliloti]QKN18006.1 transposase [Sinorhizobium meliloti WSM1022]MDW9493617.1 transposase [Sinorhizobium meliloti]MDW9561721.1 transposase [Sinorhizobium meliloti]MDW9623607.1 transposase [Sinorhizobium meliloti]
MAKVEILTGAERQRRWSAEQKLSILQEAFGPDGSVSVVARRHDILPNRYMPGERSSRRPSWKVRRAHRLSRFRLSRRRARPTALRGAAFGRGPRTLKSF